MASGNYTRSNYEEYNKHYGEVTDFTNNGKCSMCGGCCSCMLPLTKEEQKRIKQLIKVKNLKPRSLPVVAVDIDLTCPLLTEDHKCSIYDERPYICRIFKCDKPHPTYAELEPLWDAEPVNVRTLFK